MNITREERRKHVALMRTNFCFEDMHPDLDDLALQESYIEGIVSLDNLLNYARAYASKQADLAARGPW
jgi:hypothetical protein